MRSFGSSLARVMATREPRQTETSVKRILHNVKVEKKKKKATKKIFTTARSTSKNEERLLVGDQRGFYAARTDNIAQERSATGPA